MHIHVFPDFLTPVLTQLFFPKPPTTFLTCFLQRFKGENTPERKFASTGDRTRNHQEENDSDDDEEEGHDDDFGETDVEEDVDNFADDIR